MVQYKHTEHKQARRNERPLSAFVRGGERTLRKRESERLWMERDKEKTDRERKEIAGWIT